jgi:hypothetical protein
MLINGQRRIINMTELPTNNTDFSFGDISIRTTGDVSGVTLVKDTLGVIFLGLVALFLIVALTRLQARNQELMSQLLERKQLA